MLLKIILKSTFLLLVVLFVAVSVGRGVVEFIAFIAGNDIDLFTKILMFIGVGLFFSMVYFISYIEYNKHISQSKVSNEQNKSE